jgi:hypothetical protein
MTLGAVHVGLKKDKNQRRMEVLNGIDLHRLVGIYWGYGGFLKSGYPQIIQF